MGRTTVHISAIAALLAAGTFLVGGVGPGLGALAGGAVAVANWLGLRWITVRIVQGSTRQRAGVSVLLALKLAAVGAVCWAMIVDWGLHPLGFLVGVSAFALGTLTGSATTRGMIEEEG